MVENAPKAIRFLESLGVNFEEKPLMEAGHSQPRVWRTSDFTGRDILEALIRTVNKNGKVHLMENTEVVELIEKEGQCYGAFVRNSQSDTTDTKPILAKATLLATGGAGRLFSRTTNTPGAAGDGVALAIHAGVEVKDLEFVQFHPTAFALPDEGRYFLLSETLRGMGAWIVNKQGDRFLKNMTPEAELAPRDVVARAIYFEQMNGPAYLDMRHLDSDKVKKTFPNIYKYLKEKNFDLTTDLVPITPVAHYLCGGVVTDTKAATSLPGLFAAGEVARTGVHGANRLASNSLLEAVVFAGFAAENMPKYLSLTDLDAVDIEKLEPPRIQVEDLAQVKAYAQRIGQVMWEHVGLVRHAEGLKTAKRGLVEIPARDYRIQHRQLVAYHMIQACEARPESLGAHYVSTELH
jgi:L-aspartate oxidase